MSVKYFCDFSDFAQCEKPAHYFVGGTHHACKNPTHLGSVLQQRLATKASKIVSVTVEQVGS